MPLFGASHRNEPVPAPEPEPTRKSGLFSSSSSRRHPEPAPVVQEPPRKHGLFNRRTSSPSPPPAGRHSTSSSSSLGSRRGHNSGSVASGGGLLSKFGRGSDVDPSIQAARERVMSAEAAEVDADRALDAARLRVREAREQVKTLEHEAREDARRAAVKQEQAREVSKRGKGLGRKFLFYTLLCFPCLGSLLSCFQVTNMLSQVMVKT